MRAALCFALLQTSLHSRSSNVTYLVTDPTPAWLALNSWCCCGGARFALPRYRPGYIAVTYLDTDPTPARASDPAFCRSLACVDAPDSACQEMFFPLQTCVTRTSVTDLRNKIRAASRVTDLRPRITGVPLSVRWIQWLQAQSHEMPVVAGSPVGQSVSRPFARAPV